MAAGPANAELSGAGFALIGRRVADAARALGLDAPSFRSPPRTPGAHRTVRRGRAGESVVAVARRGRPVPAVVADLIEGVVVVNGLDVGAATRARTALWEAVAPEVAAHIDAA
jgi:hypothetical protein